MAGRTTSGQKYAAYKDFIGWHLKTGIDKPLDAAIGVTVWFYMPIPKSLSGKVDPGQYHTKKPDIDNLIKGLFDAANGILWIDDNRVVDMTVFKVYGNKPGIDIEIEEIGGLVHGQTEMAKPKTEKAKQKAARKEKSRARRFIQ